MKLQYGPKCREDLHSAGNSIALKQAWSWRQPYHDRTRHFYEVAFGSNKFRFRIREVALSHEA